MKTTRTKTLGLIRILLASILIPVCALHAEQKISPTSITIAEYGEYPLYAALYVAKMSGFFAAENLSVTILPAGGDEKVFAALLSGDAQFGVSDPIFTAIAGEKGKPGKVIAGILSGVPAWGVSFKSDLKEYVKPSKLGNFIVGTYPAPSTSYALQYDMFTNAGLQPRIQQIQYGALLAALKAKQIDIALENEPNVSLAESQGARVVYAISDYVPEFAFTGLMALPEYLNTHPEVTKRVVRAFVKANQFIAINQDETIKILSLRFPELTPEILSKAITRVRQRGIIPNSLQTSAKSWQTASQMRVRLGHLKQPANFETYVDNSFVQQIEKELGE